MKWCNRGNVTMLTTINQHKMINISKHGKTVKKPKVVIEYNKNVGLVDKTDVMMSFND